MVGEIGGLFIGIAIAIAVIAFIMTVGWSHAGTFWVFGLIFAAIAYIFNIFGPYTEDVTFFRYAACAGGAIGGWFFGGLVNMANRLERMQNKFDRWLDED